MLMVNVTMESNYVLIRAFFFISHTLPDEVSPRSITVNKNNTQKVKARFNVCVGVCSYSMINLGKFMHTYKVLM